MKLNRLRDVHVSAISLVKKGANNKRIFLFKSDAEEPDAADLSSGRIVKANGEWEAFYVVVAEPGTEEKPGSAPGTDQNQRDVWDSEEEIRKAAWRFMENGGLVTELHKSMEPYGKLVESTVALADFTVGPEGSGPMQTIKKGSWYVAVKPTEAGRAAIDAGELTGVSIEGTGLRIAKSDELPEPDDALVAEVESFLERERIEKDAVLVPNKPGVTNWVQKLGGLPKKIADLAGDLITEKGYTTSRAIATAIAAAKRFAAKGLPEWVAAVAHWEAMKAAAGGSLKKEDDSLEDVDEETKGFFARISKALGWKDDELPESLRPEPGTTEAVELADRVENIEKAVEKLPDVIAESIEKALPDIRGGGKGKHRRPIGDSGGPTRQVGRGASIASPRRLHVSSSHGSNRLRVAMLKAVEEHGEDLTDDQLEEILNRHAEDLEVEVEPSDLRKGDESGDDGDDDLEERVEELIKAQGEVIEGIKVLSNDVDSLVAGRSTQTERETVVKSNGTDPLAGILD